MVERHIFEPYKPKVDFLGLDSNPGCPSFVPLNLELIAYPPGLFQVV